ncbi:MAG: four helix bundle protein [Patescibacteria group bacterium]
MSATLRPPVVLIKAKEAYALWFKILSDFPKVYRYNLGGKIENLFLSFLENTVAAIYAAGEKKAAQLSLAVIRLDSLKFFLQLAWENKCLSNDKYLELAAHLEEIGRMIGGWIRGLKMKTPPNNGGEIMK